MAVIPKRPRIATDNRPHKKSSGSVRDPAGFIARGTETATITPPIFNLQMGSSGHCVRDGKTRSPKAELATLLKVRHATEVHHQHVEPFGGANVPHV
jgi:hypothetical protein